MEEPSDTQPVQILKDVVAFVDVRSGYDNRSRSICRQLELLGATIAKSLNKSVTHVVFKDGSRSTYVKATKLGIPVVSVLWIESCKENENRVSENLFPAIVSEDFISGVAKLRKMRSMQPEDVDVVLARSAVLMKRRKRRQELLEMRLQCMSPPTSYSSLLSKLLLNHSFDEAEMLATRDVCKYYEDMTPDHDFSEDEKSREETVPSLARRLIGSFPDSPILLESLARERYLEKRNLFPTCIRSPKKNIETQSDKIFGYADKHIAVNDGVLPKSLTQEMMELNLSQQIKQGNQTFTQKLPDAKFSVSDSTDGKVTKEAIHLQQNDPSLQESSIQSNKVTPANTHFNVPSVGSQASSHTSETLIDVNHSLNGHVFKIEDTKMKPAMSQTTVAVNEHSSVKDSESNSGNSAGRRKSSRRSLDDFKLVSRKRKRQKLDTSDYAAGGCQLRTSLNGTFTRHIVLTSFSRSDKESIIPIIESLGGCRLSANVTPQTTHVVCGEFRRTFNILMATVNGNWVLDQEWVFKSLEAGHWLKEDPYELSEQFPAAQVSRLHKSNNGTDYKCSLLVDVEPISISGLTKLPKSRLKSLIKLAGGHVVSLSEKTRIGIGGYVEGNGVISVTDLWVLDSISRFQLLPFDDYLITKQESKET